MRIPPVETKEQADLRRPTGRAAPAAPPADPRKIARIRRREALSRVWRTYRRSTKGMIGLGVLIFFVLVAVFAPLLASREALNATCPCNGAPFSAPSLQFPFGTDDLGRSASTIRTQLHSSYKKLGVRDRAQAVLLAHDHGWL